MHINPLSTARFLTALLIFQIGSVLASTDSTDLAAFVERGMALWNVPGMAVTVVTGDSVVFRKGFGKTSIRDGVDIDEHTQFANASTTKAMVAAGMLMLVDEGRLDLDDLVIDHLPELHFQDPLLTRQVTVRDLLAHRTGLPRTDFWTFMQGMSLEDQIRRLASVKPAAPLRARHIYQNTMYEIAGLIIERLTGQRWDRFLAERLWRPIGMKETFGARGQIPSGLAHAARPAAGLRWRRSRQRAMAPRRHERNLRCTRPDRCRPRARDAAQFHRRRAQPGRVGPPCR